MASKNSGTTPVEPDETLPDDTPPLSEPAEPAASGNRFFTWMRSLGLSRQPGWMGGVCAGIAARLGIDPLIVRGIFVVVAILGGPALLLYAAAWLLLPDANNKIHLEEVFAGRLESPIAAIGALVFLSLLPITQGFWFAGAAFWGDMSWGAAVGRAFWTIALLALLVWFVVWIARRAQRSAVPFVPPTPAADAGAADAAAATDADVATADTLSFAVAPTTTPVAPPAPAAGAAPEELAEWREKQAAWKLERDAYRAKAAADARESARVNAEAARARREVANAERNARQERWLAANPPAGGAFTAIALGGAALAGGIGALVASTPYAVVTGIAVATLFLGLSIVVAGVMRRRSGFLSFVSILALLGMLVAAVVPLGRPFVLISSGYGINGDSESSITMLSGSIDVRLDPAYTPDDADIDVWLANGDIDVYVEEGMSARIIVQKVTGSVWLAGDDEGFTLVSQSRVGNSVTSTTVVGPDPNPGVTVNIWHGSGDTLISDNNTLTTENQR